MAFIDKTIEIAADVRDVYEAWTAFADYPDVHGDHRDGDRRPGRPASLGRRGRGRHLEWDADVVEHVPDEKVTWRAIDGRETGEVRFEKLAAGRTKVTYQLKYDPAAWEGKADSVRRWMNRRVDKDLDHFKKMVEAIA